jgi:hypothetical protein
MLSSARNFRTSPYHHEIHDPKSQAYGRFAASGARYFRGCGLQVAHLFPFGMTQTALRNHPAQIKFRGGAGVGAPVVPGSRSPIISTSPIVQ